MSSIFDPRPTSLRIAELARLELTPTKSTLFTQAAGDILDYVEQIRGLDTTGVQPTSHVMNRPLDRDDPAASGLAAHEALCQRAGRRARSRSLQSAASHRMTGIDRSDPDGARDADFAAGDLSARDVTMAASTRIQALDGGLNAFRADRSPIRRVERAAALDRHASHAAGRTWARCTASRSRSKTTSCTRGVPTTASSRILAALRPAVHRDRRRAPRGGRRDHRRQDEPRRVRDGLVHRELGLSARRAIRGTLRSHARRIQRRIGRRRGRAACARSRSAPTPAARSASPRPLRHRRLEADLRTRVPLRAARVRLVARSDRPARRAPQTTRRWCSK